jgi:hypothetical protein
LPILTGWLRRHQAFGLIANRCSAAEAECLKAIRDGEQYKHLGASRTYSEKQIHCFEEFGPNYHHFAEALSPGTYRLIDGSVTEKGLEHNGEIIPITRENRARLAGAVNEVRAAAKVTNPVDAIRKRLDTLLTEVQGISNVPEQRVELIGFPDQGSYELKTLAAALRERTVIG